MDFRNFIEVEDYYHQITSGEVEGKPFKISVGKAYDFGKSNPKYLRNLPISLIKHDLSWWQGDEERMKNADTSYPLLVFRMPDGKLTVADGLNRMKKVIDIEKKNFIKAYIIPFNELPKEVFV